MLVLIRVNESNGMVTMKFGVPGNSPDRPRYEFKVDVYDSHWNVRVRSTVTVTVQTLSEEAVANSGAIRISGEFLLVLFSLGFCIYMHCELQPPPPKKKEEKKKGEGSVWVGLGGCHQMMITGLFSRRDLITISLFTATRREVSFLN